MWSTKVKRNALWCVRTRNFSTVIKIPSVCHRNFCQIVGRRRIKVICSCVLYYDETIIYYAKLFLPFSSELFLRTVVIITARLCPLYIKIHMQKPDEVNLVLSRLGWLASIKNISSIRLYIVAWLLLWHFKYPLVFHHFSQYLLACKYFRNFTLRIDVRAQRFQSFGKDMLRIFSEIVCVHFL